MIISIQSLLFCFNFHRCHSRNCINFGKITDHGFNCRLDFLNHISALYFRLATQYYEVKLI